MKATFIEHALWIGRARREELEHRRRVEEITSISGNPAYPQDPRFTPALWPAKRVELGRALAAEPELLLLDEPMAGMNVEGKQDMCRFILDVNDQLGTTIVLISTTWGGDGHFRPGGRPGLWAQDRRRRSESARNDGGCRSRLTGVAH